MNNEHPETWYCLHKNLIVDLPKCTCLMFPFFKWLKISIVHMIKSHTILVEEKARYLVFGLKLAQ
jgi:hypothetical protein